MSDRRIAWVSPLPPIPSGIGDYSFELLPLIAERARVEVFCPRPLRGGRLQVPAGVRVRSPRLLRAAARRGDVVFHHLGNNPHHAFAYRAALRVPGVAVLHDYVQHHLIYHLHIENQRNDWKGYERVLRDAYGDLGGWIAKLRSHGMATDVEKFLFPLNEAIVRASIAVVVHSHAVRERLRESFPEARVFVIPHHAGSPPAGLAAVGRREARARLGLPPDAFLVGQFGFITKPKQPAAVLGGFRALRDREPDARLLVVGANQTAGLALTDLVRDLGLGGAVHLTGYVDLERFYLHLKAVDAVVNLRYPSAGEASGTVARSLAEGRATIVSNLGSFAEIRRTSP